jgi:TP901 family phage tail tape measure protein
MQRQLAQGLTPGKLNDTRTAFRTAVQGLNDYHVEAVKNVSATAAMTEALTKNEVSIVRAYKSRKMFNDILREQLALQKATTVQWSQNAMGQTRADMIVPRGVTSNVDALTRSFSTNLRALNPLKFRTAEFGEAARVMSTRIALTTATLASSSHMMINWGKNVQWAGRQLMVGFTVPFMAFGVAAGAAAYQVDKQLTRITKVYDTTAKDAAGKQSELDRLRAESMDMAAQAAKRYGVAMKDTLSVEAELAAAGKQGRDLTTGTAEVMRASTLGELDYQQTVKASIALQSIYKYNTEQLGDAFNFMNSLENATNLSMQDMVDTIPRASGSLATLNVSLQDTGVLMAAMKERGVDAAQGANALKSAVNRVLNPGDNVVQKWADAGISITKIVKNSGGDFMKMLYAISDALRKFDDDPTKRMQLIGSLFGTMQMDRIGKVLSGLEDIHKETTQVGRAYKVAHQNAEQWGATATSEMARIQASASGKFKRALETIKASLAEAGKPFLEIGSTVLGWISKVVSAFNSLGGGAKRTIAAIMLFGAIAGPLIMIGGLIANMFGHLMKVGVAMGGLLSRTRIMTAEQRAQQMMSERSSLAWTNQAHAAQALSGQLQVLTTNLERMAVAQAQANGTGISGYRNTTPNYGTNIGGIGPAVPTGPGYRQTANGRYQNVATGRFVSAAEAQAYAAAQAAAARSTQQQAQNAAATRRSFTGIASAVGGIALMGGMMATASGHASGMLMTMTNMALIAATIGPMLVAGFKKAAAAGALADVTSAFATGRRAGSIAGRGGVGQIASGLSAAIGPARALLATFLRFAGIVGVIATVGIVISKMVGEMNRMTEAQKNIENSAKSWADVLGFVYEEASNIETVSGKTVNNYDAMASKFREANKDTADYLRSLKDAGHRQEAINASIYEGVKVKTHGGTASEAKNAVATALRAAGFKTNEINEILIDIKGRIKFDTDDETLKEQAKAFTDKFHKIATNQLGQGKWEGAVRLFSGRDEINNKSAEAAKGMAKQFWDTFDATTNQQQKRNIFLGLQGAVQKQQKEMWDSLGEENKKNLAKYGITTAEELQKAYLDNKNLSEEDFHKKYFSGDMGKSNQLKMQLNDLGGDTSMMVGKQAGAEYELAQAIAVKNGATKEELKNIYTLNDLMPQLDMALMSAKDAQNAYGQAVAQRELQWQKISPKSAAAQQLKLLNIYRAKAGLADATSVEQGFGDVIDKNTGKLKDNANALDENAMSADTFNNARKDAMSNASSAAFSQADELWNRQADSEVKAIEDRGERLSDALDKRSERMDKSFDNRQEAADNRFDKREKNLDKKWDGIMDRFDARWDRRIEKEKAAYDKKIDNIKKAIKAEEDAEATRQKIFEAEKTRLERMADIANKRIDFNMALNTGNLDEAAKVFNDIQSTQDSWTLDDAAGESQDASQQRIDTMNGNITTLEGARDKRIEALQKVEEAEKKALEDKKEREKEALAAEKDRYMKALAAERERYRKGIEAQKEAIRKQTQADADAKRRDLERQKRTLDMELAAIRASTPRNKKEYDKQIRDIEDAYKKYGVRLEGYGQDWTKYIGDNLSANVKASAISLQNDIKWKSIGSAVTQDMVDGGFNMTTAEFMKWVTTGDLPKNYKAPSKPKTRHTGGPVSGNSKYDNRGGRHWGAGLRRDESMMLLKNDEFVVNGKAHKALGTDALDSLNKTGSLPGKGTGGIGGRGLGFVGAFAAALSGMSSKAIQTAIDTKGAQASAMAADMMAIPGAAGMYGKIMLSGEQLANAATIMSVGKSMGGTTRDLIIGIMTAMQESGLRNLDYGDRDSLGLFQQRPSMGWGTPEQIRTPSYAAKKFFQQELKVKGREKMAPTLVAQAVQRSGFPYAYAKWEDMARAIVTGTVFQGGGNVAATGGKARPVSGPVSRDWYHHSNLPRATDFGVPVGTPVHAATGGQVVTSTDLHGGPGNGGYRSYGRYIVIQNGADRTLYAHLSSRNIAAGSNVRPGQLIGYSGNTGNSTGPHLHFETWRGGVDIPPGKFGIPGLNTGGFTMNDGLAMLHKNEAVLTAPLTEQLKSGIQKIDQGSTNEYNVNVTFTGPVNSEIDVEKAVTRAIQKRESRLGRKRSISN